MEGVIDDEIKIFLSFEPDLFFIGMITLPDQAIFEPHIQFQHEPRTIVVDETPTMEKVKILTIVEWTLSHDTQVQKINMGTIEDPKYFKLNIDLEGMVVAVDEDLL
jgi:hypothetical protein